MVLLSIGIKRTGVRIVCTKWVGNAYRLKTQREDGPCVCGRLGLEAL